MSDFLSTVSKNFGKALILGAFLPVVIFVSLGVALIYPILPDSWAPLQALEHVSTNWRIVLVGFLVVVLAGLLYNLNYSLTRLFEGYPWRDTRLGKRFKEQHTARWKRLGDDQEKLIDEMRPLDRGSIAYREKRSKWNQLQDERSAKYPSRENLILPTQLGNRIRSFEEYPDRQYRMDAIVLWPRLAAVIDKDYAGTIESAQTTVNFMLNCSVLSALLALALLCIGLRYATPSSDLHAWLPWAIETAILAVCSWLFYAGAISRVGEWGETVKGAFDLYRWELLKQMGYTEPPKKKTDERDLWYDISRQIKNGDLPARRNPDYAAPTIASGWSDEGYSVLEIARGVAHHRTDGAMTVSLEIRNPIDTESVRDVTITDTLPDGYDYEWGTACLDGGEVQVTGTGPFRFKVGAMQPGQRKLLTYKVVLRPTP